MIGIALKSARELVVLTAIFGIAFAVMERLMTEVVPQLDTAMLNDLWARLPFIRQFLSVLIGDDVGQELHTGMLVAFFWVHPVVLATVWGHAVAASTRVPAGEIDRGTIDVLLALPVSRRRMYVADTVVILASSLVVLGLGLCGYLLGSGSILPESRPAISHVLVVLGNLFALNVAVIGMAMLGSALCDRRGRAIGTVFGILVGSMLLNFLAPNAAWAARISFLGVLDYYQPVDILKTGDVPIRNIVTLLLTGCVLWVAGAEVFARRSICTT